MNIGVVAIGRNEGERLRACLESARRDCAQVVYVDSGSGDGSVELAKGMGAVVVELDLSRPFTAARARNEGFDRLMAMDSTIECVQFVDGDCEIVAGWIAAAAQEMARNGRVGVVCGRRRERFAEKSIYNRLCDLEWNTPVGEAMACG
jgi:glycosyltransferase involved in cell wall biosynthesis